MSATDEISAERAAHIDAILTADREATLARIDAMSTTRRALLAELANDFPYSRGPLPVIDTDSDPTPHANVRPLFAKFAR